MKKLVLGWMAAAALQASGASAATTVIKAKLYVAGEGTTGTPAFTQETTYVDQADGTQKESAWLKDEKGEEAMREEAVLKGPEVISQQMDQLQTKERYELKREAKEILFRTYDLSKTPPELSVENKEEAPGDFVTGPAVGAFLRAHWEDLRSGKTVPASFGVFEIRRSVGFEFTWQSVKDGEVTIRMKPASTLISMIVSPIFLYVSEDGKTIRRLKGRTPLKRKVMGNWKPFDAEILYETSTHP